MLVYREAERREDPRLALDRLVATLRELDPNDHDGIVALLVEFGEIEAAILDALFPAADGLSPIADRLGAAALAIAALFEASRTAMASAEEIRSCMLALDAIAPSALPAKVARRVSEGYAYYALYPETYALAAERYIAGRGAGEVVCIGLRSIGTSLSGVVSAALAARGASVHRLLLRPRGHPFDRRPVLAGALSADLARRNAADFLLVDEGPGLSGSSLAGTAALLSELYVPDERIAFLPSWSPDVAALTSETARARWGRHGVYRADFEEVWPPAPLPRDGLRDLGGGEWRRLVYASERRWPAVQPQHERRKFLCSVEAARALWPAASSGSSVLLKFAGIGAYGRERLDRAEALAGAGFGSEVLGLHRGFLALRFIPGKPVSAPADPALLRHAVDYLAFVQSRFRTGAAADARALRAMAEANIGEALGEAWLKRARPILEGRLPDAPEIALDARMLPHEWLRTEAGYLKTDSADHQDDHFYPGPADIAWDVAGLIAEFGLPRRAAQAIAAALSERTGDTTLATRLPFHLVAYLAFRMAYAALAAQAVGAGSDARRQRLLSARYSRQLRIAILAAT